MSGLDSFLVFLGVMAFLAGPLAKHLHELEILRRCPREEERCYPGPGQQTRDPLEDHPFAIAPKNEGILRYATGKLK
jgi:hypothetical protein